MTGVPEITTQCFVSPMQPSFISAAAPSGYTHTALPVVASDSVAESDLATYLAHVRDGGDPAEFPEAWLRELENGAPRNCKWPLVLGAEKNKHVEVAHIYRKIREELIHEKNSMGTIEAKKDFFSFARVLYENIPPTYEYVASLKEFWMLLSVYVVPDWVWSCYETPEKPMSTDVEGARFLLKRGLVRDALARHWWKCHVLTEALGRSPRPAEYSNTAPSTWQERTRMYSYPEIVKQTVTAAAEYSSTNDPAKAAGKALYVYDATSEVVGRALGSPTEPSEKRRPA